MKNLVLVLTLLLGFNSLANAFTIEVAPLSLEAKVAALGMEVGVDGKRVIILTGKAAEEVARVGVFAFDKSKEMLILTGKEVHAFLENPLKEAAHLGKMTIIGTTHLLDFAVDTAVYALQIGAATVERSANFAASSVKLIASELKKFAKRPIAYVGDRGIKVIKYGHKIVKGTLKFSCKVLAFIGISLGC